MRTGTQADSGGPSGGSNRSERTAETAGLVLLIGAIWALGFAVFRPCLDGYFLADDFGLVQLYSRQRLTDLARFFWSDFSDGIWGGPVGGLRPVAGMAFWLDYQLWGANAFGYQLSNLVFYLVAVTALVLLVRESFLDLGGAGLPGWTGRLTAAAAAGMLFLVHPSHAEPVAWIAGRFDGLMTAGSLWSTLLWIRATRGAGPRPGRAVVAALVFAAALYSKDSAVVVPGLWIVYALLRGDLPRRWRSLAISLAPTAVVLIGWLVARRVAFGSLAVGGVSLWRWLGWMPVYAGVVLDPPFAHPGLVGVLILAASGLVGLTRWRSSGRLWLFWGLAWPCVLIAPTAQTTYVSPRHLLVMSAWPVVLLGLAVAEVWARRYMRLAVVATALALGVHYRDALREKIQPWQRSAGHSRDLIALLRSTSFCPQDVVVLSGLPDATVCFWQWALPYAAQPPFLGQDVRVLAPEYEWCCSGWVEGQRKTLDAIGGGELPWLYRVDYDRHARRFSLTRVVNPIGARARPELTPTKVEEWLHRIRKAPSVADQPAGTSTCEAPQGPT